MNSLENTHLLTSIVLATGENEELLRMSIDSIIGQTVFKEEQVEIILVNNSDSNDNIMNLYLEYKQRHENQIKYVEAFNATVPKAFNKGIKFIEGIYVNFLVAGGKHEKKVVEKIQKVFIENEGVIELVAAPIRYKGLGKEFLSSINYKSNKVIDLLDTPQKIQISIQNSFIKADVLRELQFNENLAYTYEVDLAIKILSRKKKYRTMKASALTTCHFYDDQYNKLMSVRDKKWYDELIDGALLPQFEEFKKREIIPKFMQLIGMYLLQWRFMANQNNANKQALVKEQVDEFIDKVSGLLEYIDDDIILNRNKYKIFKSPTRLHIIWIYIKNKDKECYKKFKYLVSSDNVYFTYKENIITSFKAYKLEINVMEYTNGILNIHATHTGPFDMEKCILYAQLNNQRYEGIKSPRYGLKKYFGKALYKNQAFCFEIPLQQEDDHQHIFFFLEYGGKKVKLDLKFVKNHARLSNTKKGTYWAFDRYIAEYRKKGILVLQKSKKRLIKREVKLIAKLALKGNKSEKKSALLRMAYWITKPYFLKQRIWLTFDKIYKGGDNGEYFARYVTKRDKDIKMYYVVAKNAPFKKQLIKDGVRAVEYGSLKHRLVFLNAQTVFTTHTRVYDFNGFGPHINQYFRDLTHFDIVCIQHGLTVQKFAHTLNKDFDDTKRFYCASKYEIEDNLAKPIYGYNVEEDLRLTGSPRYDGLINNDQKQILISPTWRMNVAMPDVIGEVRGYNPNFKESTYFKVYNEIINNKQFINKAKELGYSIKYVLHPNLSSQIDDFDRDDYVEIIPASGNMSYEKILTESSLMVTDYSGIQFDFAYMRKPIIYLHHMELPPHYEEGCFYYKTMGFGEICIDTQALINTLCEYMQNGCAMKNEYIDRANDFFAYSDYNNCKRIYEDIIEKYKREEDKR